MLDRIITISLGQLSLSDQLRWTTISATNKRFNFHNGPVNLTVKIENRRGDNYHWDTRNWDFILVSGSFNFPSY